VQKKRIGKTIKINGSGIKMALCSSSTAIIKPFQLDSVEQRELGKTTLVKELLILLKTKA
jgi:hypothetical protein